MDYRNNIFDKRVATHINKLRQEYVIDFLTAERLQDILVYLYLSQDNKNQRGINLQTENLKNLLHNQPKIKAPAD